MFVCYYGCRLSFVVVLSLFYFEVLLFKKIVVLLDSTWHSFQRLSIPPFQRYGSIFDGKRKKKILIILLKIHTR
jgi:hypothetical protein